MQAIVFNDYVDAALGGFFMFVVVAMLLFAIRSILQAHGAGKVTSREADVVWRKEIVNA